MTNLATYITIYNYTDEDFVLYDHSSTHGYWETEPPTKVFGHTTSKQFELKDRKAVASGSEGTITYAIKAGEYYNHIYKASFCCSWSANNNYAYFGGESHDVYDTYFNVTVNGKTYHDECPESGHPIILQLYIQPVGRKRNYSIE